DLGEGEVLAGGQVAGFGHAAGLQELGDIAHEVGATRGGLHVDVVEPLGNDGQGYDPQAHDYRHVEFTLALKALQNQFHFNVLSITNGLRVFKPFLVSAGSGSTDSAGFL